MINGAHAERIPVLANGSSRTRAPSLGVGVLHEPRHRLFCVRSKPDELRVRPLGQLVVPLVDAVAEDSQRR